MRSFVFSVMCIAPMAVGIHDINDSILRACEVLEDVFMVLYILATPQLLHALTSPDDLRSI